MLQVLTVNKQDQNIKAYYPNHFMQPLHELYFWGRWAISTEKLVRMNVVSNINYSLWPNKLSLFGQRKLRLHPCFLLISFCKQKVRAVLPLDL